MQIFNLRNIWFTLVMLMGLLTVCGSAQTSLVEQGRAAIGRGDTAAAIDILEKAVAESPSDSKAHYYLGSAYGAEAQKGGMFAGIKYGSKVKEQFEKAIELDPKNTDARYGLMQLYAMAPSMMGGSPEKALEQAKEIKAIDVVLGHRAYAFAYTQAKKPELAKQEYLDGVREQPKSPKAHSFLGQYLTNVEKDYTAAFTEFETALKLDPKYMAAYYHLGRTAGLGKTNFARGEDGLKKYLTYTPKENEPPLANAHYYLGLIYENQGKKAEAKQSYQAALNLNPSLKDAIEALKRVS